MHTSSVTCRNYPSAWLTTLGDGNVTVSINEACRVCPYVFDENSTIGAQQSPRTARCFDDAKVFTIHFEQCAKFLRGQIAVIDVLA